MLILDKKFKKEILKCFLIELKMTKPMETNLLIGVPETLQIEKEILIKTIIIHLKILLKHLIKKKYNNRVLKCKLRVRNKE